MVMNGRDDRSELRKILDDSIKFDWMLKSNQPSRFLLVKLWLDGARGCALQRHRTAPSLSAQVINNCCGLLSAILIAQICRSQ